ncbi:MAG: hypothetical protein GHCLOJNM_02281 [bacterium]|nr:hypothetical protein [bacterium]
MLGVEMKRRTFLKTLPAVPLFAETRLGGASRGAYGSQTTGGETIGLRVEATPDPLLARVVAILKDRIERRCPSRVAETDSDARILLTADDSLPPEGFRIEEAGTAVRVAGGSTRGLLHGVGKFLRTCRFEGSFQASSWRGTSAPHGSLRGMYFATHFHNWYQVAPEAELARYMEDVALWGVNALMVCFPFITLRDWEDPGTEVALAMTRKYARLAKDLGLQFGIGVGNTLFTGAPESIRATRLPDPTRRRGNSGHPICPNIPEGRTYILENTRRLFQELAEPGLDFVVSWPYDEGGCACEKCLPWGSNGFLRLSRDVTVLGREHFPKLKLILSTWMFDTPPEGEWRGLSEALAKDPGWADYILADSHEEFPRYPLESGVPGNLPLLNFPEISMWGNWPWGGVGANPLPARFERLWRDVKQAVRGGFPYSEGIYEDMNKAVVVQFYWDPDRSARSILDEYITYEFGPGVAEDCHALVGMLETAAGLSYMKQPVDAREAERAFELAEGIRGRLPEWARRNWRWEILHLRALLDRERFAGGGLETPAAQAALTRLVEIYHCERVTDDPYHHRVRPPLRGLSTRGKEL